MSPHDSVTDQHEPVFNEPWEAQAFSLAVGLSERGVFTWPQWAEALAGVIADPESAQLPYYEQWLLALEKLLIGRGLLSAQELSTRRELWRAAARATPHGEPIVLPRSREIVRAAGRAPEATPPA